MIVYLDTSALVKKYFMESGSADVISLWQKLEFPNRCHSCESRNPLFHQGTSWNDRKKLHIEI